MGRRRKDQASLDLATAMDAAEVLPESVEAQEGAVLAPESVIVAEYHDDLPIKQPDTWMVVEEAVVSLFGQMTTLPVGTIVSARSYGPQGVKRIIEQGVMLEPVG